MQIVKTCLASLNVSYRFVDELCRMTRMMMLMEQRTALFLVLFAFLSFLLTSQHLLNIVERLALCFRNNEEDEDRADNRESREQPESFSIA